MFADRGGAIGSDRGAAGGALGNDRMLKTNIMVGIVTLTLDWRLAASVYRTARTEAFNIWQQENCARYAS